MSSVKHWWRSRSWAAKIAVFASLLATLLMGAAVVIFELQEAFVVGYEQPDLLFSDLTELDEIAFDLLSLSFVSLLVAIAAVLLAGLMRVMRGVRTKPLP